MIYFVIVMPQATEYNYKEHNMSRFGVATEHQIVDTQGRPFTVKLFQYPTPSVYVKDAFPNRENHFQNDPRLAPYADQVHDLLRVAFRDDSPEHKSTDGRFGYVSSDDSLDLVISKGQAGQEVVVGVHSYKTIVLPGYNLTPALYTHYAAVHPDFSGGNIRRVSAMPIMDTFKPEVFCGSTHSDAILASIVTMARDMGYELYPKVDQDPLKWVYRLGRAVLSASLSVEAQLGSDLVRTGSSPYTQDASGRLPHPIAQRLNLTPNQAVLYVAISPRLLKVIDKS